jgi:hypothetical protein
MPYEEEDTCVVRGGGYMSYEEEDTCVIRGGGYMSYEEEDTCVIRGGEYISYETVDPDHLAHTQCHIIIHSVASSYIVSHHHT